MAYSKAEGWAHDLLDDFEFDMEPEGMIQITTRLSALLGDLREIISQVDEHPKNPKSENYKLHLN